LTVHSCPTRRSSDLKLTISCITNVSGLILHGKEKTASLIWKHAVNDGEICRLIRFSYIALSGVRDDFMSVDTGVQRADRIFYRSIQTVLRRDVLSTRCPPELFRSCSERWLVSFIAGCIGISDIISKRLLLSLLGDHSARRRIKASQHR